MDNGWEWQERTALSRESAGGDDLAGNAECWDSEEWHRWTPESKSLSSPTQLDSCIWSSIVWQPDWIAGFSPFGVKSGSETSLNLPLGVVKGDFNLSTLVGDTEEICWSNAFRYSERRYCSKYTTSNSSTAISLISSVAG